MICNVIINKALFKKTKNSSKPHLFKTFKATNSIIDKTSGKKLQRNIYRHIIAYADDIVITTTNATEIDDIVNIVSNSLDKFGLKISAVKEVARELAAESAKSDIAFLDAPVSGGQAGAENGVLTVMVGGDQEIFDQARPVIDSYARAVGLMGPVGSGQLTKMVNQICIAGLVQGLSEGLDFASRCGLDVGKVLEVISKGAAQSWQIENRGHTMERDEFEFGFAVDWMRKDLGLCLDEARRVKGRLPITALVDQFYAEVQAMGGGRWDTSSLIRRLRDN